METHWKPQRSMETLVMEHEDASATLEFPKHELELLSISSTVKRAMDQTNEFAYLDIHTESVIHTS